MLSVWQIPHGGTGGDSAIWMASPHCQTDALRPPPAPHRYGTQPSVILPSRGVAFGAVVPEENPELRNHARNLLTDAEACWRAFGPRRQEYFDAASLVRGRHYEGTVIGPDGQQMSKEAYLEMMGRKKAVFNLVEPMLKKVLGDHRQNESQRDAFPVGPADAMLADQVNAARRSMRRTSRSDELEADAYTTHIVAGWAMFRSEIARANGPGSGPFKNVVRDHTVHPARAFYNLDVADRRMLNLRMIGETMDLTPQEIVHRFSRGHADAERILSYFDLSPDILNDPYGGRGATAGHWGAGSGRLWGTNGDAGTFGFFRGLSFRESSDEATKRVTVIWAREYEWQTWGVDPLAQIPEMHALNAVTIAQGEGPLPAHLTLPQLDGSPSQPNWQAIQIENNARQMMGLPPLEIRAPEFLPCWKYYVLAPRGDVIRHGRSPFWGGEHPYSVSQAMHLDGETWGMISTLGDPQRWMNARWSDIDHAIRTGTKGTLLVNKAALEGSGLTEADLNAALDRGDASIVLAKAGLDWSEVFYFLPPQPLPPGLFEVVSLMPDLMDRMTGVSAPSRGEDVGSVTATQFERQVMQSGTMTHVYGDTYYEGLQRKDVKEVRLLQQAVASPTSFYDLKNREMVAYDPSSVRAFEFDVAMGATANTPTARLNDEATLRADLEMGLIDADMYYELSGRPDAPLILQKRRERAQMEAALLAEAAGSVAPEEDDTAAEGGTDQPNRPTGRL
ncbi:MAG: hypothetical protein Rubg2KO_15470 [Rubricoccaceae bacterium]